MYLFLIILLGTCLRLINIDKLEGLWNDEYVSWFISATPFNNGFFSEILKQCHMPLYYFYLKPFANCSDLFLRLTSVLPSVLTIVVMYLIGKEFSKKTGYICATITAILPFIVYYSQEVRFYSLLLFFSALSLLFIIRIINNNKGWVGYWISITLILLTHVIGGIYVLMTLLYLYTNKKSFNKKSLFILISLVLLVTPFGLNIIKMIPSSQWWGDFSYTNILFLFSDYLSPILTNHINAPDKFFYSNDYKLIFIMIVPTLLGFYKLCKTSVKLKGLTLIALGTIFITALLAISGKIVFITKYTIEILPIIILLLSLEIKERFDVYIIGLFIFFNLCALFTPYYPTKAVRAEGHKLVANILNDIKTDKIIFTYYEPNRFKRYLKKDCEMTHISKINRFEYVNNPAKILTNVKQNERIAIVFLDSISFIPPEYIDIATENNLPEMFITFSKIKNELIKELNNNYGNFDIKKDGSWLVINATKLK